MSMINDGTNVYATLSAESKIGTALYKISLSDFSVGTTAVYTGQTTDITNKQVFSAVPAFFGTSYVMVPILNNLNTLTTDVNTEHMTLMMVRKSDLGIDR
jgi:hypothetical protein